MKTQLAVQIHMTGEYLDGQAHDLVFEGLCLRRGALQAAIRLHVQSGSALQQRTNRAAYHQIVQSVISPHRRAAHNNQQHCMPSNSHMCTAFPRLACIDGSPAEQWQLAHHMACSTAKALPGAACSASRGSSMSSSVPSGLLAVSPTTAPGSWLSTCRFARRINVNMWDTVAKCNMLRPPPGVLQPGPRCTSVYRSVVSGFTVLDKEEVCLCKDDQRLAREQAGRQCRRRCCQEALPGDQARPARQHDHFGWQSVTRVCMQLWGSLEAVAVGNYLMIPDSKRDNNALPSTAVRTC